MKIILIGTVGHWTSGKSTLAKKLANDLKINHIRNDAIRDFLISEIIYYNKAQYSHCNPLINSANRVVYSFRDDLVKELVSQNQSLIIDSIGSTKEGRKKNIEFAKKLNKNIISVLIYVEEDEKIILNRLKERDKHMNWKWEEIHQTLRKKQFEIPEKTEADYVLKFNNNYKEIFEKLKDLII